jgi:hypothetical protein
MAEERGGEMYMQCFHRKTEISGRLGKHRRRWQNNIKTELRDVGWELDLSDSGEGQVAGFCECGNERSVPIK